MGLEKCHCLCRNQVLIPHMRGNKLYCGALSNPLIIGQGERNICQGPGEAKNCVWLPWHPDKTPLGGGVFPL